jgi:hypothetical protein
MLKTYQTFIANQQDIPESKETVLVIKDLSPGPRKYDALRVKAIIHKSGEPQPEEDKLLVRSEVGVLQDYQWRMRILEKLPDLIPIPPYSDYRLSR